MGLSRGEKYICLLALCFVLATVGASLLRGRGGPSLPAVSAPVPSAPPEAASAWEDGRLRLNAAAAEELDALPGIGPVLAERIVAHRDDVGPFASVEDLDAVSGIGPAVMANLRDLVTV